MGFSTRKTLILFLLFLLPVLFIPFTIKGDGIFLFCTLRSLVIDGNIDLHEECQHYPQIVQSFGYELPTGHINNPFPIGPIILWLPFYLIAYFFILFFLLYFPQDTNKVS